MTPPRILVHCATFLPALAVLGGSLLLWGCNEDEAGKSRALPGDPIAAAGDEVAASHVLVAWTGTRDAPAGLQRTRAEAEARARRIAVILRTGRGDLGAMARRYSDDPSALRNAGYLGVFTPDDVDPAVAAAVCSLQVGEIAGPVETPYGFHVLRREPVRRVRIHHVLVAHAEAVQAGDVRRTRAEAARIARALQRKLAAGDAAPCEIAARFSDDPQNRRACGDLGWVEPGMLEPAIEQAVFALEPGACTDVLESQYGFHVFWRE